MPRSITHLRSAIANHGLALCAAIIVLLCFTWMTTYGTFEVFEPEHFGQFYDAQAASLLAGHWDVPTNAIFPEGFYRDGKAYGYFGFVPALPRMLLNHLFPALSGAWSRLSMIVACAVTLACCYGILQRVQRSGELKERTNFQRSADAVFLLTAGLGSTVIYLSSRAFIYHEAILWGVALALACYVQLLDYLANERWPHLLAACLLAYLSFFTRISSGLGPMVALVLLALSAIGSRRVRPGGRGSMRRAAENADPGDARRPRPPRRTLRRHFQIRDGSSIAIALTFSLVTCIYINHAKFGAWLQSAPMQFHEQVARDPSRFVRTGGQWMSFGNIPTTAYAYLSPSSVPFSPEFPWVYLQERLRLFPGQHIDRWGPFSSVTTSMPAFLILALVGLGCGTMRHRRLKSIANNQACPALSRSYPVSRPSRPCPWHKRRQISITRRWDSLRSEDTGGTSAIRRRIETENSHPGSSSGGKLILLSSVVPVLAILAFSNIDNRYLHEFFPLLIIASAFGMRCLSSIKNRTVKTLLVGVLLLGGAAQIYANCAYALVYQRLWVYDRPMGPEMQMRHWQQTIDHVFR